MHRILPLLCLASVASAQNPLVDIDFDELTPEPDMDAVVVRELFYGAGGVDLTAWGIGQAPVDFVQSIYVRFYRGSAPGSRYLRLRLTFPQGAVILGIVTDDNELGGSGDDGVLTALDQVFGIDPSLADKYSSPDRGLEASGDEGVWIVEDNVAFLSMEVTTGLDDARIIVDYGSSFPASMAFDVETLDATLATQPRIEPGVRVGDAGGVVLGAGDMGEARGVLGIPITAGVPPTLGSGILLNPSSTLFLVRDTAATKLDAFDPALGFAIPNVIFEDGVGNPIAALPGPLGLQWVIGDQTGIAAAAPWTPATSDGDTSSNLPGLITSAARTDSEEFLYLARNNNSGAGEAFVDEVRLCDFEITRSMAIPQSAMPSPRGLAYGSDGMLYALDAGGLLVQLDPVTEAWTSVFDFNANSHVALGSNPSGTLLYALRDAGTTTEIQRYDVTTGVGTSVLASVPERSPRDVTADHAGTIWVYGQGGSGAPRRLIGLDPVSLGITTQSDFVAFRGTVRALSSGAPATTWSNFCGPSERNSAAYAATLRARTSGAAGAPVELSSYGLPTNQFGYYIAGQGSNPIFPVSGSSGRICLGGAQIARYNAQVLNSGTGGRFCTDVSTLVIPLTPAVAAQPGETWNFQAWYRDGMTSNFTDAISIQFQ